MKNNEIITIAPMTISATTFKDDRLNKATQRIVAIFNDAAKYADLKNREIAKVLADVSEKKAYEADGFKSVADYASDVFGIARQNAYTLANAGKIYNDKEAHPELQAMSPSKLAEIASLSASDITTALDTGKISHNTTQKDLREFAANVKSDPNSQTFKSIPPEKPVVLTRYIARPCVPNITEDQISLYSSPKSMEEWDHFFTHYVMDASKSDTVETHKLPKGKVDLNSDKATVNRVLYLTRTFSLVVEFFTYVPPKAKKEKKSVAKKPKYTKEQLMAMLAELESPDEDTSEDESK